jgi:site-specific DNA recombinase
MTTTSKAARLARARSERRSSGETLNAIIYRRVSDKGQVENGNGLESQETTCREYAERRGYNVIAVFSDDLTGKTANRDGLKELLAFLKKQKSGTRVIIDDLNRLARSVRTHFAIRDAITAAGGKLESPKRVFADDPEDDILEVIEAAFAGEHRRKNAEQTLSRMRARCLGGHWCLQLPYGYKYRKEKTKGQGAVIERDEPVATIIQDALEAYASGHLTTQADVARFLGEHAHFPRDRVNKVRDQVANNILTNPLYAGYVQVPKWDVSLRPGHHPALISFETFQRIQRRLASNSRGMVRKDNSQDFALRGYVICGSCNTRLTSYWAKGSHRHYAYYHCREESCEAYSRAIPRAKIEGEFGELLQSLQPSPRLFHMVHQSLRMLWDQMSHRAGDRKKALTLEVRDVEHEIAKLVDRIIDTDNETLIAAYEKRIGEAENRKLELAEKLDNCGRPLANFDAAFRTAITFLANPYKLWVSDRIDLKHMVLKLVFAERLEYVRNVGFRTPLTSSPFRLLQAAKAEIGEMVHPERFERPTLRFVV